MSAVVMEVVACEAVMALDWTDTAPSRVMLTGGDVLHRRPRAGLLKLRGLATLPIWWRI